MAQLTQNIQQQEGCRRTRTERRQANLRSCLYALFMSRRRNDRRAGHGNANIYTDVYGPHIFLAALTVMLFCILDAFFTLILLERGASELNPFLAWLLEIDVMWFYSAKYIITAICVFWVVIHKHFDFFGFKGKHVMLGAIVSYMTLITYQISMLLDTPTL
jgi:hypothetical protein